MDFASQKSNAVPTTDNSAQQQALMQQATAPAQKQADQRAGDAAVNRIAVAPVAQTAPVATAPAQAQATAANGAQKPTEMATAPEAKGVETRSYGSASLDVAQAEAAVTSVTADNRPVFSITTRIPLDSINQAGVSLQDLQQLADVSVATGAGLSQSKGFAWHMDGNAVVFTLSNCAATQVVNSTEFNLTTASGKQLFFNVHVHQFHTDEAEWLRSGLRMAIGETQGTIDTFQKALLGDQAIAKSPPPANVSVEQGQLTGMLSQIDQLNSQVGARVPQLMAQWKQVDGHTEASTLIGMANDGGDIAKAMAAEGQAFDALLSKRDQLDAQIVSAKNSAAAAHDIDNTIQTADTKAQAQAADAQVAQLTAQRADVDTQAKALSQKIFAELDGQADYVEQLMRHYEELLRSLTGNALPPGAQELSALLGQRNLLTFEANTLRSTIADKLAEPAKAQAAAQARAGRDTQTIADLRASLAAQQAQLAAINAPVYTTLDETGNGLSAPSTTAKA